MVEGNGHAGDLGDHLGQRNDAPQVISFEQAWIGSEDTRHHTLERGDPVAFTDAQHRGVHVARPCFERRLGIGDRTAGVVVAVEAEVGVQLVGEQADHGIDLPRCGDPDRVRDADPVDAQIVHGAQNGQHLVETAAKRVLAAEAHLQTGILHLAHAGTCRFLDGLERATVASFAQKG